MYVPSHLHHMLFELLKNSLRAVVERYGEDCGEWPEIKVIVAEGKEDITIKISDEGGGIPRSGVQLVWTYMYTTAENPKLSEGDYRNDYRAPLAGYVHLPALCQSPCTNPKSLLLFYPPIALDTDYPYRDFTPGTLVAI